ncbi:MAG: hypothetical protein WA989_13800 [Henriciella sp.]|uniref:hypothetical protein n=1 Tax=Henriciella sp. TaxID=1968823 RepID=UPI003C7803FC
MPSDVYTEPRRDIITAIDVAPQRQRDFSWSAALAGFVCALALQGLFSLFGIGWGFDTIDPASESSPFGGLALGAGLYWLITSLLSVFAGGYVAAQVSGRPHMLPAVLHGITVWALATLVSFWAITAALSSTARATASAAEQIGQGGAAAIGAVADADLMPEGTTDMVAQELDQAIDNRERVMEDIRTEVRDLYREVVSPQERQRVEAIAEDVASDVMRTPGDFSSDISLGLDRMFGSNAPLSAQDRAELEAALGERFDISEQQARRIAERWETRWQEANERVEELYRESKEAVLQASEEVAETSADAAFALAIASFLGLLAAAAGGLVGTPSARRDEEIA